MSASDCLSGDIHEGSSAIVRVMRATNASHASHKREPCEPQARATSASHASHKREPCEPTTFYLVTCVQHKKTYLDKKVVFLFSRLRLNYSPTCSHKARECTNTHSLRLVSTRSYGWNYYIENNTWAHS